MFEGVDWIAHVDIELLYDPASGRRYSNFDIRLATDGCLLRSDSDMRRRGEIGSVLRMLHHGRPFYDMTAQGASVFAPIRAYMLSAIEATSAAEPRVNFSALYCGSQDRIDLKCEDRRVPSLVRTVGVTFEPGWPASTVPLNHPWPVRD